MQSEVWRDVPGFEGHYQVSDFGSVKSLDRYIDHPRIGKIFRKGKVLKQSYASKGYKQVCLNVEGKTTTFRVHRLVAMAFLENPKDLETVNHIDGNKENNHVSNLEWCSVADNLRHASANGLMNHSSVTGSLNVNAILDEEKVYAMMNDYFLKDRIFKEIAKDYGISIATAYQAVKGSTWKQVQKRWREENGFGNEIATATGALPGDNHQKRVEAIRRDGFDGECGRRDGEDDRNRLRTRRNKVLERAYRRSNPGLRSEGMKEFMTLYDAAERWNVNENTLRSRLFQDEKNKRSLRGSKKFGSVWGITDAYMKNREWRNRNHEDRH